MGEPAMGDLDAEISRCFKICSADGSTLTQPELGFFLRALGKNPTNAQIQALPAGVDEAGAKAEFEKDASPALGKLELMKLFAVWDPKMKAEEGTELTEAGPPGYPEAEWSLKFSDFKQCLMVFGTATGDAFGDEEIKRLMAEGGVADESGDFKYANFLNLMVETQKPHTNASLDDTWPKGAATVYA